MVFLGFLALLALVPAFRQGNADAFWTALPGISQALGGLLAIYATYQIAARSEERAKKFEEATEARETRFDERAEARSIRADKAADDRMAAADRASLRRAREAERRVVRNFSKVVTGLLDQASDAVAEQIGWIDKGETASEGSLALRFEAIAQALDAVARVPIDDAKLLEAVYQAKRCASMPFLVGYGAGAQAANRKRLTERMKMIEDARRNVVLLTPKG